jgi:hypothetical protein
MMNNINKLLAVVVALVMLVLYTNASFAQNRLFRFAPDKRRPPQCTEYQNDEENFELQAAWLEWAEWYMKNFMNNKIYLYDFNYNNETMDHFIEAERCTNLSKNLYIKTAAKLLLVEAYAKHNTTVGRAIEPGPKPNSFKIWTPYKYALLRLKEASDLNDKLTDPGFKADFSFFAALQYDYLTYFLEPLDKKGTYRVHADREYCKDQSIKAINRAITNERKTRQYIEKMRRFNKGTAKYYLFSEVKDYFEGTGVDAIPIIGLPDNYKYSLHQLSNVAHERSKINFSETKAFQFFDLIANIIVPKYGMLKKTLKLLQ